jgi:hypothetical protein
MGRPAALLQRAVGLLSAGVLVVVVAVSGLQGPAVAAPPHAGKYQGATVEGPDKAAGSITIKAKNATTIAVIRHVDSCGDVWRYTNVPVQANGTFSLEVKRDHVNVLLWKIRGKFVKGGTKVRGAITYVGCEEDVVFTAVEK